MAPLLTSPLLLAASHALTAAGREVEIGTFLTLTGGTESRLVVRHTNRAIVHAAAYVRENADGVLVCWRASRVARTVDVKKIQTIVDRVRL